MKARNHYQHALKIAGQGTFLAALLGFGSLAHGQGYSTVFSPANGYSRNTTLSGQEGWDTNDPDNGLQAPTSSVNDSGSEIGQTDEVVNQNPPGTTSTDYYAANGGLLQGNYIPGQGTVQLFHAANVQGAASFTVNSDAFLTSSQVTGAFTAADTFGYSFLNASGVSLFGVNFVPLTTPTALAPNGATDSIFYTVNGVRSTVQSGVLALNGYFHISVAVVGGATPTLSFTVTESGAAVATVTGVALTAADATTVANVGTTWTLSNQTADANGGYEGAGSNTLYFKNLAVVVPEPSTYAMLGLGALGLALRFRRKVQA